MTLSPYLPFALSPYRPIASSLPRAFGLSVFHHCAGGDLDRAAADIHVVADLGAMDRVAVEIRRDRPGADVHVPAERRVAKVAVVPGPGPAAQRAVLDLGEHADHHVVLQHRAVAEVGERADRTVL